MILRPMPISSSAFTYLAESKSFVAEASDLGPSFNPGRVYDDACDEGFTIVSERTGNEVVFAQDGTITDREGDVQGWEYVAVTPGHKGLKATIFND